MFNVLDLRQRCRSFVVGNGGAQLIARECKPVTAICIGGVAPRVRVDVANGYIYRGRMTTALYLDEFHNPGDGMSVSQRFLLALLFSF